MWAASSSHHRLVRHTALTVRAGSGSTTTIHHPWHLGQWQKQHTVRRGSPCPPPHPAPCLPSPAYDQRRSFLPAAKGGPGCSWSLLPRSRSRSCCCCCCVLPPPLAHVERVRPAGRGNGGGWCVATTRRQPPLLLVLLSRRGLSGLWVASSFTYGWWGGKRDTWGQSTGNEWNNARVVGASTPPPCAHRATLEESFGGLGHRTLRFRHQSMTGFLESSANGGRPPSRHTIPEMRPTPPFDSSIDPQHQGDGRPVLPSPSARGHKPACAFSLPCAPARAQSPFC